MRPLLCVDLAGDPGDSCINQVLSITREIYSSFDDGFEVRSIFMDISKAFGKVWRKAI